LEASTKEIKYWVAFSFVPTIGRVRLSRLRTHFGNLEDAWKADAQELVRAGLDSTTVRSVISWRPRVDPDAETEKMARYGVQALTFLDPHYPSRLKETHDYPPVLYVRGSFLPEDAWCLAVVGTRRASAYGKQVTEEIVADLAASGITIVSGLAKGIDSIAHRTALEAGGRSIAVFACGLDCVYPAENVGLARRMEHQGALISEHPLGIRPKPEYFPRRNRIMSGMSLGVLVVEAGESSGALITANLALEQNREVLAVPGSILSPSNRGTNRLIQEGAKLVTHYRDILEELNLGAVTQQIEMKELLPESDTESDILKQLTAEPTHIDEVCRASGLPVPTVSSTLAMMELKGLVRSVGNMKYVLAREARQEYRVRVD